MSEYYIAYNITKEYSGVRVLNTVNFKIETGKIHGLFGHNGAGKSTLLKILAGVEQQTSGVLELMGEPKNFLSPHDALSQGVACVYQELRLIDNLTVAQNIFLGREITQWGRINEQAMHNYTKNLLEEYGVGIDPGSHIKDISHPLKQMVEVITNLDRKAKFVFLDEPTTALEYRQAEDLLTRVNSLVQDRKIGIVIVSHKIDEVLPYCDDVTVLSEGQTVFESSRQNFTKKDIVDAIVSKEGATTKAVVEQKISRNIDGNSPPMLNVKGLKTNKLNGINMTVHGGEVFGIYGLVGSGRTSFAQTLYGMCEITEGSVEIADISYRPRNNYDAIKKGVAYLTEDRKHGGIIPEMSALVNANLISIDRYSNGIYLDLKKADTSAYEILKEMRIKGDPSRSIKYLSGGNQQKALLARIIGQKADIIILDEPTKGVDLGAKSDIYHIIDDLAKNGCCVIVISSEEEELMQVCDRVAIFSKGTCTGETLSGSEITISNLRKAVC
ncbi:MAG: sugar ABC transporter ATP-binding protein [Brevinema sp.]